LNSSWPVFFLIRDDFVSSLHKTGRFVFPAREKIGIFAARERAGAGGGQKSKLRKKQRWHSSAGQLNKKRNFFFSFFSPPCVRVSTVLCGNNSLRERETDIDTFLLLLLVRLIFSPLALVVVVCVWKNSIFPLT
jgi:hypothetical protein